MEISKKQCQSMHKPKAVGLTLQEIAKLFPKTTNKGGVRKIKMEI